MLVGIDVVAEEVNKAPVVPLELCPGNSFRDSLLLPPITTVGMLRCVAEEYDLVVVRAWESLW